MIFRKTASASTLTRFYGSAIDDLVAARLVDTANGSNCGGRILVTSAERKAGKTTTAMALALTAARDKPSQRVLLVDLDLRRQAISNKLGLSKSAGIREVAMGKASLAEVVFDTEIDNLTVIGAGHCPADLPECFSSTHFEAFMGQIRDEFDLVYCDSPALVDHVDAKVLATHMDSVLLVTQTKRTTREMLVDARNALGDKLSGVFVNGYKDPVPKLLRRWV